MGKRFVPVRDVDKRAIELYLALREVENMPLVVLRVRKDSKEPIAFGDKGGDPDSWRAFTIDAFLRLDIEKAKAKGGTAFDLATSYKPRPPARIPQREVDRGVQQFFSGEDDE